MNSSILLNVATSGIILLLIICSIWSVAVMIERNRFFKKINEETDYQKLKKMIEENSLQNLKEKKLPPSLSAQLIYLLTNHPHSPKSMEKIYSNFIAENKKEFEKGFTVLGSLGSNAPFIGLLGTVLGVVKAFSALSQAQSSNAQVMSSIAEALLHTALGLFVAIPAVIAFNYFVRKLQLYLSDLESLKDLIIQRYYQHNGE